MIDTHKYDMREKTKIIHAGEDDEHLRCIANLKREIDEVKQLLGEMKALLDEENKVCSN